jgi:hypothetical protein
LALRERLTESSFPFFVDSIRVDTKPREILQATQHGDRSVAHGGAAQLQMMEMLKQRQGATLPFRLAHYNGSPGLGTPQVRRRDSQTYQLVQICP